MWTFGKSTFIAPAALALAFSAAEAAPVATLLASGGAGSGFGNLITDGTNVYISGNVGSSGANLSEILRVGIGGGAVTTFSGAHNPNGVATDGTNVYWIDPNAAPVPSGGTAIFRRAIAAGDTTISPTAGTGNDIGAGGTVDGVGLEYDSGTGLLYAADDFGGRVFQVTTGGAATQIGPNNWGLNFAEERYVDVATGGGKVWLFDSGHAGTGVLPRILSHAIGSTAGAWTLETAGGPLGSFGLGGGLAYGGGSLFMAYGNAIYTLTGGTLALYAADAAWTSLSGLFFHGGALYLTENDTQGGHLWRVAEQAAVPAPASLGLFAAALAGLGALRRRRR